MEVFTGSCFENSDYLNLTTDVIDSAAGTIVKTLTEHTIQLHTKNRLVVFELTSGLYTYE